jgi:hypothetical protein
VAAKRGAAKKASVFNSPGLVIIIVIVVFLALAWPTVVFHGSTRWIAEGIWAGALILLIASVAGRHIWSHRDERKHPAQPDAEQQHQAAE